MSGEYLPEQGPWRHALREWVGSPYRTRWLAGKGGPGCWRLRGPWGQAVLKIGIPRRERLFYEIFAPRLQEWGLTVPTLYASGSEPDWIILQWVEKSLNRSVWGRDTRAFAYLAKWHEAGQHIMEQFDEGFQFPEPRVNQEAVVSLLPKESADLILHLVHKFSDQFHAILQPVTWVHGDTNPTNWLVAPNGKRLLTDWARYGQAHPAVDVAIFLPGLPSPRLIQDAAECYVQKQSSQKKEHIQEFKGYIALAKLCSAIEFLGMFWGKGLNEVSQDAVNMLKESLGDWVREVFSV